MVLVGKELDMARIRIEATETQEGHIFVVTDAELRALQSSDYSTPAKTRAELEKRIGRKFTGDEAYQARQAYRPLLKEVPVRASPLPATAIGKKKMPRTRQWGPRPAFRR
jgi:hypothetical protein